MSDLTTTEKRKLERLLGMASGYVLNFSNRTFEDFILECTGRAIYDTKYEFGSGSKANRLRGFWNVEGNQTTGKLLTDMIAYGLGEGLLTNITLVEECRKIATRLSQDSTVPEIDTLIAVINEPDFECVAKAAREAIEKNEPESGLDRLHTFVVKFIRSLCQQSNLQTNRDKPLHSLFGEYVRHIRDGGFIETDMSERILKSSISTFEAFNHVRNYRSLAHDNPLLNYDEALLIFNHVCSTIRFLRGLEGRIKQRRQAEATKDGGDEIPF